MAALPYFVQTRAKTSGKVRFRRVILDKLEYLGSLPSTSPGSPRQETADVKGVDHRGNGCGHSPADLILVGFGH